VDETLFSASKGYLLRSDDQGDSWQKTSLRYHGIRRKLAGYLNALMIKLKIPFHWTDLLVSDLEQERPWPTVIVISPAYAKDKTLFFGTREHGIYRSADGGHTVKKLWDATGRVVTSLVISPDYAADQTLFASIRNLGVYKSIDAGDSWTDASMGFDFIADWQNDSLVHQIEKKDIKLIISPEFKQDGTLFARSSEGLYKSTNAGDSWMRIEAPIFDIDTNIIGAGISPDFRHDRRLIISLKGQGLYETTDGGDSFRLLTEDLIKHNQGIEYIQFSPSYHADKTILAASDEDVFISSNSGNRWQLLTRPVRYENHREDALRFHGDWQVKHGPDYSAGSISSSTSPDASVELDFVGSGIIWIGPDFPGPGDVNITVDGTKQSISQPTGKNREHSAVIFARYGLTEGSHHIRIETERTQDRSKPVLISVDAFDVIP
jgi:photosystem II stability/assembly factor-like uncharacterized protein